MYVKAAWIPFVVTVGACLVLAEARVCLAYPGDVVTVPAPVQGLPKAETVEIPAGTYSVSTRTGSAQYSFRIQLPPGRRGMEPSLVLDYSSQSPMRGGIAAGWTLSIPTIRVDTSSGRLAETNYLSGLAGGQRLVSIEEPVSGPGVKAFRAESDATYARYEKFPLAGSDSSAWRVLTSNGLTWYFGDASAARDVAGPHGSEARWFPTRTVDRFGNEVTYHYEPVLGNALNGRIKNQRVDISLSRIEYSRNVAAGLQAHAQILFHYSPTPELCPGSNVPIGAQFNYRTGIRLYEGARRLTSIVIQVRQTPASPWKTRRQIDLTYDKEALRCDQRHAPTRLLTEIRERVWSVGNQITLVPPVKFSYSRTQISLTEKKPAPATVRADQAGIIGSGKTALNVEKAGGWPTIDRMLLDLDGDGLIDILRSTARVAPEKDVFCSFEWMRNLGDGQFSDWETFNLPTFPWANSPNNLLGGFRNSGSAGNDQLREACNLAYQFTRRTNRDSCPGLATNYVSYRFMDLNGDGVKDLVVALDTKRGRYSPAGDIALSNAGLFGTKPICPVAPPCRNPENDAIACRTDFRFGNPLLAITSTEGNGSDGPLGPSNPTCTFPDQPCPQNCPLGKTRDPFCVSGESETCPCRDDLGELAKRIGSEFEAPSLPESWNGAPFREGEVGHETVRRSWGGPLCVQEPEMACKDTVGNSLPLTHYLWRIYWNGDGPSPQSMPEPPCTVNDGIECPGIDPGGVFTDEPSRTREPEPPCVDGSAIGCAGENTEGVFVDNTSRRGEAGRFFFSKPDVVFSPIPLDSDRATSTLGGQGPASSWHGFVDMDGDGYLDAVWQEPDQAPNGATQWPAVQDTHRFLVFRGDGKGRFLPDKNGEPYRWSTPPLGKRARVSLSATGYVEPPIGLHGNLNDVALHRFTEEVVSLQDINGDGLPDYVESRKIGKSKKLRVFFNTGRGFETGQAGNDLGTILTDAFDTIVREESIALSVEDNLQMKTGWSMFTRRLVDVDGDGLPDVAVLSPPQKGQRNPWASKGAKLRSVAFHMNVGDRLVSVPRSGTTDKWWSGLARIQLQTRGRWIVKTDFDDLDGDGMLDLYNNSTNSSSNCNPIPGGPEFDSLCGTSSEMLSDPAATQGFRLLTSVDNGRGARIAFQYASNGNSTAIQSDPATGHRSPHLLRVVRSIKVDPGFGTAAQTDYTYRHPTQTPDRRGKIQFRGFSEATTHHPADPSGVRASTVERFDFELDYSGRLVDVIMIDGEGRVAQIRSTIWQEMRLFAGAVRTYHVREERQTTCDSSNNNSESACRDAAAFRREMRAWTPMATEVPDEPVATMSETGSPRFQPSTEAKRDPLCPPKAISPDTAILPKRNVMVVQCGSRITDKNGFVHAGDRGEFSDYLLVYRPDAYQLLPTVLRKIQAEEQSSGPTWNVIRTRGQRSIEYDSGLLGLPERTREWHDDVTVASTRRTYDLTTGNVTSEQKAQQFADGSAQRRDFVYDQFGLFPVDVTNELGHVTTIETDPANGLAVRVRKPLQPGVGRPEERTRYDGLGRVVQRLRSVDKASGGYQLKLYEHVSYFDMELPRRMRHKKLLNYDDEKAVIVESTFDGLQRPLTKSTLTAKGLAKTTLRYEARGNVSELSAPNPRGDDLPDSTYKYEYDSLGRIVRWSPPIGANVSLTFDGLLTTRTEVPSDGSVAKPVKLRRDVFGRLRTVIEKGPNGEDAVTSYEYNANDALKRVEDADGIVTELEHDFVGHRKEIRRGLRKWRLEYDLNGNRTAVVAPHSDELPEDRFESRFTYDALDRVVTHSPAIRDLSTEDLQRYAVGTTQFLYDVSSTKNGVGRLGKVVLPFATIAYNYTAEGWVADEERDLEIGQLEPGALKDKRIKRYEYNALGLPIVIVHADSSSKPSTTLVTYDERGLPNSFAIRRVASSEPPVIVAKIERNRNGQPIVRKSFAQRQRMSYDELGRLIDHRVTIGQNLLAGETLEYDEVGNTRSMSNLGSGIVLNYGFDAQHQLIEARSADNQAYVARFTYSPTGRVMFAEINGAFPGGEVIPRRVRHEYPDLNSTSLSLDPGAVRQLTSVDDAESSIATYEYDSSGNRVSKTSPGNVMRFVYDGSDRLREAIKENDNGREIYYYDHTGKRMASVSKTSGVGTRVWWGETELRFGADGKMVASRVYIGNDDSVAYIENGKTATPTMLYEGIARNTLAGIGRTGTIVARFAYGPYGEVLFKDGSAPDAHDRRFNAKTFDEISQLSYYGYRYYDQLSLDWTQSDPQFRFVPELAGEEPRKLNLYAFALRNPLKMIDPDGRESLGIIEWAQINFTMIGQGTDITNTKIVSMDEHTWGDEFKGLYVAWTNTSKKLYVNPEFFRMSRLEQDASLFHEGVHIKEFSAKKDKIPTYKEMVSMEIRAYRKTLKWIDENKDRYDPNDVKKVRSDTEKSLNKFEYMDDKLCKTNEDCHIALETYVDPKIENDTASLPEHKDSNKNGKPDELYDREGDRP